MSYKEPTEFGIDPSSGFSAIEVDEIKKVNASESLFSRPRSRTEVNKGKSFMFAVLAVLFVCLALFLTIAPLLFVKGTLRTGAAYSREKIKLTTANRSLRIPRIPDGTEMVFDTKIYDLNGNAVTTVFTLPVVYQVGGRYALNTNIQQPVDIVYLPIWPYIYVAQADYNYVNFALIATVCAVIGFALWLGALHFKRKCHSP